VRIYSPDKKSLGSLVGGVNLPQFIFERFVFLEGLFDGLFGGNLFPFFHDSFN
jgi:hypothetical protein